MKMDVSYLRAQLGIDSMALAGSWLQGRPSDKRYTDRVDGT